MFRDNLKDEKALLLTDGKVQANIYLFYVSETKIQECCLLKILAHYSIIGKEYM